MPAELAESAETVGPSCSRLEADSSVQSSRSLEPRFRSIPRSRAAKIAFGDLGTSATTAVGDLPAHRGRTSAGEAFGIDWFRVWESGGDQSAPGSYPGARAGPARLHGSPAAAGTNGPAGGKQPGGNSTVSSPARSRAEASR